ncbi:hypothetical protein BTVI_149010 [Pitangus sulphuratus]|nr:hypothetical protein BTVI_149010 [Pitangus sulphuratus]
MLRSYSDAADAAPGAQGSSQKYRKVKPEPTWLLAYVPIRSCHRVLKDKYGEFSPPAYRGDFPISFWCNWTIWAGSRKHIIVYIQGFNTKEDCNKNEDKILFEGVSSLVENSVVYSCWKKEMHVFATFAQAVHVVLLKRYLPNCRDAQFKGKYYIFQDQEGESSSKDNITSETPAPKLPKQHSIFQSGWVENLRSVLGFSTTCSTRRLGKTTVLGGELMQERGITLNTMAVGSPIELIPCERAKMLPLETKAPGELGSELLGVQEAQGTGTPEGIIPTAAQNSWGQSLSVSGDITVGFGYMHRLSSVLLETPLLGALHAAEPLLQPAGVSLENSQSVLSTTLKPKGLGDLQFTIKPTHTGCLDSAAHSQSVSPVRGESQESAGTTRNQQLSTVSLEEGESHPQLSIPADGTASSEADGLAQGLTPSLSSPYEVVNKDHLNLLPGRSPSCQSSLRHLSTPKSELGTAGLRHTKLMGISPLESSRGVVRRKTVLLPTAPWDILQEHPHLHGQSSHVLHSDPTNKKLPQNAQTGDCPAAEKAHVYSSGVQSCDHQSDRAAQPGLAAHTLPAGLEHPLTPMAAPGTETTPLLVTSSTAPVPVDFSSMNSIPEVPLPPQVEPVSKVASLPAALDLDLVSPRRKVDMSPASPGGQEMVCPSPPCHSSQQRTVSFSTTPAHPDLPAAPWEGTLSRDQKPWDPSDVSRNTQIPGQQQKHAGATTIDDGLDFGQWSGVFYLPLHADIKTNIWCNWTIWAGPQKHIVIYVQGFEGSDGCGNNQDKIIFQGVSSTVETKVVYACHNRGTLVFATQAAEVQVLFLSGSGSQSHKYKYFKGQYYVFRDPEVVGSSNDTIAAPQEPDQETSKKERTEATKGLLSMLTASPGPPAAPAGGRIQPEFVSPDGKAQHPPDPIKDAPIKDAQFGTNLSKLDPSEHGQLQDETKLEKSLQDSGTEGRETEDDVLVKTAPAGQDAGCKAEPSAVELTKGNVEPVTTLTTIVPSHSTNFPFSEMPSSDTGASDKSSSRGQASDSLSEEVAAATHRTQAPVLEEPPLDTSTKPSFYPSPGVTAGDTVSLGERTEELSDLVSALASLENGTALQSQHHPGDMLFEVTIEVKPKDWIPHGGSELQKGLLESVKNHIQKNLKLSANRVNEIKLNNVKSTRDANLLLTFWLHLKPEERNVSLHLRSQLEELLGNSAGAEKLQLVSLFVQDVNECNAGVGLCGEEAECFNGVGSYLCRCKQGYEDHSPTKSGTLCIRTPRSGISFFLRHADTVVGAAIVAVLVMLAAAGVLCVTAMWRWHPKRSPGPEEPSVRAVEEPEMELHDLGECLRLDPFQLKLRARHPEWLWSVRAHHGQVFLEQSSPL